jgi:hypothetical protein
MPGNSSNFSELMERLSYWRMVLSAFIHGAGTVDDVVNVRNEMNDWLRGYRGVEK